MTAAFALLLAASAPQTPPTTIIPESAEVAQIRLTEPGGGPNRLRLMMYMRPTPSAKLSPQKFGDPAIQWEFPFLAAGYAVNPRAAEQFDLRFRIYSQMRRLQGDPVMDIGKMLLRLYDYNFRTLRIDHSPRYNRGVVDVYLAFGGVSGGEQRFDTDFQSGQPVPVNTIYIYDLPSFTNPLEMAREIAHEYGHATIPPIGGFETPEDWANGYLGEGIYLRWIANEMRKGRYGAPDAMGADQAALDEYVTKQVVPKATRAATNGPTLRFAGKGQMDGFLGLCFWISELYGDRTMITGLTYTDPNRAGDTLKGLQQAFEEAANVPLRFPERLHGQLVWVPVGTGRVQGSKAVKRSGMWEQHRAAPGQFQLIVGAPK